jgi:membrane protein
MLKRKQKKENRLGIKDYWAILKEAFGGFDEDRVMKLSAALAYYTVFSIAPMLIILIGVAGIFFGQDAIQGQVYYQLGNLVGHDAAVQIEEVLRKTTLSHDNVWATIIGLVTLLLGATGIFGEIQDSINFIWGLKTRPKKGFIKLLLNRLISFSMIVALGFLLMVSLVLNALLAVFLEKLNDMFSDQLVNYVFIIDYALMFASISLLFACIFKVLPDAKIRWKDVRTGSMVTALLFMGGKFLIGYYLKNNATINAYGTAGSLIVLLLWVYYSAIILYFGAEFTKSHALKRGIYIEPNRYAEWIIIPDHMKHEHENLKENNKVPGKKASPANTTSTPG